jgi:hypothetical protein
MQWKLFTRDAKVSPPVVGSQPFASREAAMNAACNLLVSIEHIEGPNGETISSAEIDAWCKGRRAGSI